jgi:hypothetical protein
MGHPHRRPHNRPIPHFVQKLTTSFSSRSHRFLQIRERGEREEKAKNSGHGREHSRSVTHTRSFQLGGTLLCLRSRARPIPKAPPAPASDSTLLLRHSPSRGSNNLSFSTTPPCPSQYNHSPNLPQIFDVECEPDLGVGELVMGMGFRGLGQGDLFGVMGILVMFGDFLSKRQKNVQYNHAQYNPKRVIKHHHIKFPK